MKRFKKIRPLYAGLGLAILLILGALYIFILGYYPALTVNGQTISKHEVDVNYGAARRYYDQFKKIYPNVTSTLSDGDIQAQVIGNLIESALVHQAAQKELGNDLGYLVNAKVAEYDHDPQLGQAARTVYGLGAGDFHSEVLVPQAEHDILAGRVFLNNQDMNTVLADLKKSAQVRIFSNKFRWDGSNVIVN